MSATRTGQLRCPWASRDQHLSAQQVVCLEAEEYTDSSLASPSWAEGALKRAPPLSLCQHMESSQGRPLII